jgi:hypothetical protein
MTGNEDEPRARFDTATGRRITGYDPHTGEPILAAPSGSANPQWLVNLQERYRGMSRQGQVMVGVGALGLALLTVLIVAGTSGGSSSASAPYHGWHGVVPGKMVGDGNIGASESLVSTHVYCGWKGNHVKVHADLTNGLGKASDPVQIVSNAEAVTISPIYTIALTNGGEQRHGDGLFSTIDVRVPAGKTVSWIGDAGHPEGIKEGAPIGSCVPEVMDVTH